MQQKSNKSYSYYARIDADGTIFTHEYPNIGKDIGAIPVLKDMVAYGAGLIVDTMRCGEQLEDVINWYKQHDIPVFAVQENPTQKSWTSSPKIYAHVIIDDTALGIPLVDNPNGRPYVDWVKVRNLLIRGGFLPLQKENIRMVIEALKVNVDDLPTDYELKQLMGVGAFNLIENEVEEFDIESPSRIGYNMCIAIEQCTVNDDVLVDKYLQALADYLNNAGRTYKAKKWRLAGTNPNSII